MGFVDAVKSFFKRYADFKGRSSRSEYWWAYLGIIIIYFIVGLISSLLGETIGGFVVLILLLAIIVPSIAVAVRRLHDLDKSGWFYLLALVPIVSLILLYWFCQKGTDGTNQYGPDPLGSDANVFN